MNDSLRDKLWKLLRRNLPRVLSQLNRDQDSPLFGSFDRNFWHYKIRDFSSVILQQGILIPDFLKDYEVEDNPLFNHPLMEKWIQGSLKFWASQQLRSGSFNEYYPFEEGYPPTAFSLYTVGLIFKNRGFSKPEEKVSGAIQKACEWLIRHPEREALNQEAAGLAGLTLCSKIPGIKVDDNKLKSRLSELYDRQSGEGWFPEYDGPDTGYLSVTIDCLWDIFEVSGDNRAYLAMEKAVEYIASMISVSGETPIMINSRNTDYIVFYGISRMAESNPLASLILQKLINNTGKPDYYLNRTDDRYISHYVYQSCFRSLPFLDKICTPVKSLHADNKKNIIYREAGIYIEHRKDNCSIYVNASKGGIVNIFDTKGIIDADFGWRARLSRNNIAVTHWLNKSYYINIDSKDNIVITGKMSAHSWMKPSPAKHIILRSVSYFFGNRLIPWLKKLMIFGDKEIDVSFTRQVIIHDHNIEIEDDFTGKALSNIQLYRAPHYSLRHVSSAGLYVPEELLLIEETEAVKEKEKIHFKRIINL